jgi:glutamate---cysteine ligase / carboxylate-amine ligase
VRIDFRPSPRPTLGVEWELALVDRRSGDLACVAQTVLDAVRPDGADVHPRIKQELLLNTVEVVTGICESVAEAADDLTASIAEVRTVTDALDVELFCAGTHPFADWAGQRVTNKQRYAKLIDRTQWWGRQMLIYGVHVHVGMASVHQVMPVLDGLLTYFPHLQALSASSPFWGGQDTGYASNRALMFQQLPTAGLPFQFDDWAGYEAYVEDMFVTGVIDDLAEIRWDIRPSPALGTVEQRVCDGLPTLQEVRAVAALSHCLVVDLCRRLDDGEVLTTLPPWHVQENKWRSARYGLEAEIILDAAGRERLVTDDLVDLLERLAPTAAQLGCADDLALVEEVLRHGASYQRQRRVAEQAGGDLRAVVDSLVAEMRDGLGALPLAQQQ